LITTNKPLIVLAATPADRITIVAEFPGATPEALFDYWIKPELFKRWWPSEVELTPEKGGNYHLSWPSQSWHLRGTFAEFNGGKELDFTRKWDHETVEPVLVRLNFEPTQNGGTKLTLHHGVYPANPEGKENRDAHRRLDVLSRKAS
jgi:uncharacterized protein YndB with AHSA1/START domain